MPTIPQRIASAFAVLCGRYGDVTKMAQDREQSRQSLYREAEQVVEAVDGTAAQARIDELQRQLAEQQAEVQALQERLKHAVEITPDKQHEFATVAQAEGVSLSVARRLLRVVTGPRPPPSVRDAGAGDPRGRHAGRPACSRCSTRRPGPRSNRPPPTRFFWPQTRPDGRRAREPLLADGSDGQGARRRHLGRGIRPVPGACRRWSATTARAWAKG